MAWKIFGVLSIFLSVWFIYWPFHKLFAKADGKHQDRTRVRSGMN